MRTIIYYFTGTGNSLAAARRIAAELGDTELVGIPSLRDRARIVPEAPRIGIVCPVHGFALPGIVSEFIKRLEFSSVRSTFLILTPALSSGGALSFARRAFRKAGKDLDAGFIVRMPSNDIVLANVQPAEKRDSILATADSQLVEIAREIAGGKHRVPRAGPIGLLLTATVGPLLSRHRHSMDRRFSVGNSCTSCGVCVRVCPVNNIALQGGRPKWLHRCEACLACINYCPIQAIQYGRHTARRGRYHHPQVSVADLAAQKLPTSSGSPSA